MLRLGWAQRNPQAKLMGLAYVAAEWSPCFKTSAPQKWLGPAVGSLAKMLIISGGRCRDQNSGTWQLTVLRVQETMDREGLEPESEAEWPSSGVHGCWEEDSWLVRG